MEITEDDETVYDDAIDVTPTDEEPTGETDGGWGEKSFEDYPTEPGAYTVYAWRGDRSREDRESVDFREWDAECVELQIHIGDSSDENIESGLNIWRTFECRD
ncbi:hypothetical protein [Natronorubrum sp. DTA7]|uniref:hypothetical protein n=1 Tax=Natronorubrum sp. DTA7 TaxID=3447016 RepID=UPI003F84CA01